MNDRSESNCLVGGAVARRKVAGVEVQPRLDGKAMFFLGTKPQYRRLTERTPHRDRRGTVRTTEVRITDEEDFGSLLKNMRLWLDAQPIRANELTYFDLDPGMMIRVLFRR